MKSMRRHVKQEQMKKSRREDPQIIFNDSVKQKIGRKTKSKEETAK